VAADPSSAATLNLELVRLGRCARDLILSDETQLIRAHDVRARERRYLGWT
jgi:hypothetical protein